VLDLPDKAQVIESIKTNGLVPLSVAEEKNSTFNEFYKSFLTEWV